MYVLSALDKSIHQMSKCWQQKLLSEYPLYFALLTNLLWFVFEYLCGNISRQNASYQQGFQLGGLLEMPAYAWLLSPRTYVRYSSISQRSFLGPAASPLILCSQETEILLLSGISN